jgi:catechol 2,3-dioxygenase-like lactoylglutathione lyase family enzyme
MIDHTGVHLSDFARSKVFYTQALALKPEDWGAFVLYPSGQNMDAVCHGPGRA